MFLTAKLPSVTTANQPQLHRLQALLPCVSLAPSPGQSESGPTTSSADYVVTHALPPNHFTYLTLLMRRHVT